jgi:hypothetical protein
VANTEANSRPCIQCGAAPVSGSLYCRAHGGRLPLPGDDGYLEWLFAKFEAGYVAEGEWQQLSTLHETIIGVAA